MEGALKPISDFRSKDLIAAKPFQTTAVDLKGKKGDHELALEKIGGTRWRILKPDMGEADYDGDPTMPTEPAVLAKKISGVHELLNQIEGIRVESDSDFIADCYFEAFAFL